MRNEVFDPMSSTNDELIKFIDSDNELDEQIKNEIIEGIKEAGWAFFESLPVIGEFTGGVRRAVDIISTRYKINRQLKLYKYVSGIKECSDDISKYLTDDNVSFVIKKLLEDDEDSKIKFYARLTIALSSKSLDELSKNDRINLASILSNLTFSDIEIARKYYIFNKYEVDSSGFIIEQLSNLSSTTDGITLKGIQSLISNGLIYESKINKTMPYDYNIITKLLSYLIEFIYLTEELDPLSIGEKFDNRKSVDIFVFNAMQTKVNKEKYSEALDVKNVDEKCKNELRYNKTLNDIVDILCENKFDYKVGDEYSFKECRDNSKLQIYIEGDANQYFKHIYDDNIPRIIVSSSNRTLESFFNHETRTHIYFGDKDNEKLELVQSIKYFLN